MNAEQRRVVTAEFYDVLANELRHHADNGSQFLYDDPLTVDTVALRTTILRKVADMLARRATKLFRAREKK